MIDDDELVRRAKAGDRWAQEVIFKRYVNDVGRLASRLLARIDEADDVVQETFTSALTSLDDLESGKDLRRWLLGIAMNRVRRRFKRRRIIDVIWRSRDEPDAQLASLASAACSAETVSDLRKIDAVLARLPSDDRITWMLRYVEGESFEEIAGLMSCSVSTAKRRVSAVQVQLLGTLGRGGLP